MENSLVIVCFLVFLGAIYLWTRKSQCEPEDFDNSLNDEQKQKESKSD